MVHPPSSPTPGARSGSCWRCCEVRSRSWWPPGGRTSGRCRSSEWRYLFLVGGQAGARQGPSGALGPGAAASRFRGLAGRCSSGETRAATVRADCDDLGFPDQQARRNDYTGERARPILRADCDDLGFPDQQARRNDYTGERARPIRRVLCHVCVSAAVGLGRAGGSRGAARRFGRAARAGRCGGLGG